MRELKLITVNLCECCAVVAANGDDSGCRDYHEHENHALNATTGPTWVDEFMGEDETFTCDGCGWSITRGKFYIGTMDVTNVAA